MVLFNNFTKRYQNNKHAQNAAAQEVFVSGRLELGEPLRAFEEEFVNYPGVGNCIGIASGTEAIALSLMELGIGPGDEAITTNFTAFPTISGIMHAGVIPVFVDITVDDGLIECDKIAAKITSKTTVAEHLYGIQTMVHYPIPANRQAAYPPHKEEYLESSEARTRNAFCLPLYPELNDDEEDLAIEVINGFK